MCERKETADEFTEDQWRHVNEVIRKHRSKPGALIPVLEEVQGITGYLPEPVQRRVAKGLGIPLSQVYGVVTFYSFFTMKPRGKHQIRVCLGTACHVRGSKRVLDEMEQKLGIEPGECTEDREFSLDVVRCVGACGLAPVMVVDEDTHKQVKVARLDQILSKYSRQPEE
jgi:NADH-quinone oxidoreductase E subunit